MSKSTLNLASLMDKTPNDKSIWQQSKGVFNDGTEIISETFEAGAELVRAVRKSLNLLNLQIDVYTPCVLLQCIQYTYS